MYPRHHLPWRMQRKLNSRSLTTMAHFYNDRRCMLSYWLFFLGFALAIGALLAKTWRINKILRQENFRRVEVQPMDVILPGALLFLSNFVIMLAWNTISPLGYEVVLDDEDLSQQDEFGRCVEDHFGLSWIVVPNTPFLDLLRRMMHAFLRKVQFPIFTLFCHCSL